MPSISVGTGISPGVNIQIPKPEIQDNFSIFYILFLAVGFAGIFFILKIGVFKIIKSIF